MYYSVQSVAQAIQAAVHGNGDLKSSVRHLLIDSRTISQPEGTLFFALKSDRNDGHRYLADAFKKRVRLFVVSEVPSGAAENFPGACFLLVKDTLAALQALAAWHRSRFNIPVVGITGSNGKTIVKEWMYQLLSEDRSVVRSPKSYNSQVGVPLSVWLLAEEHQLALFEAGISHPGEMEKLEPIIRPGIGMVTNIGQAHDENFPAGADKVKDKLQLFRHAPVIIYSRDHLPLHEAIMADAELSVRRLFTWSRRAKADLQIGKITRAEKETELQAVFQNEFIKIRIPFTDEASIENAIHCWALLLYLGVKPSVIADRMLRLSPVAMRLELKEGVNNCSVINDSYNSDLGSLAIALDFLNQQKQHPRRTLILSDIFQTGRNEAELYAEVARLVKEKGVSRLIGIGEAISRQANQFQTDKSFFRDTQEFLNLYSPSLFSNETILLKGSRLFGFERISSVLQQKAHETVMEISLNALVHNLNYYRSKLAPGTKTMAMVKAFSYGSGGFEIANILQYHHVDYLAVAYADEGIELREAGISLPIMVMNPEEPSYDAMIRYDLEPEIFSFRVMKLFEEAVKRNGRADAAYPIHIKLDTGMHRLGFNEGEVNELAVRLGNSRLLEVRSVFSHLAASDEPEHDAYTLEQLKKFSAMSEVVCSRFDYPILRHILNSAGAVRFPGAQFDMVRLGIGLYGVGAGEAEQAQLKNVSTLRTSISQIRQIPSGESVGYSRRFRAQRETRIATVPIGYADGLSRRLGNGKGKLWVGGKAAPIVGSVCMDMCMIDVTDIRCEEGDEVIVFGNDYPVTRLAKDMDTIPYEVFTGISRRVKRVYFHE